MLACLCKVGAGHLAMTLLRLSCWISMATAFAELQIDLNDVMHVKDGSYPFRDFPSYAMRLLFPRDGDQHLVLKPVEVRHALLYSHLHLHLLPLLNPPPHVPTSLCSCFLCPSSISSSSSTISFSLLPPSLPSPTLPSPPSPLPSPPSPPSHVPPSPPHSSTISPSLFHHLPSLLFHHLPLIPPSLPLSFQMVKIMKKLSSS